MSVRDAGIETGRRLSARGAASIRGDERREIHRICRLSIGRVHVFAHESGHSLAGVARRVGRRIRIDVDADGGVGGRERADD